jgi:hypothetical protein
MRDVGVANAATIARGSEDRNHDGQHRREAYRRMPQHQFWQWARVFRDHSIESPHRFVKIGPFTSRSMVLGSSRSSLHLRSLPCR